MTAPSPGAAPRPSPDLFGVQSSPLLRLGEVEQLFCDRFGIDRSTYFESYRPWLPVVYTRMVPVRGRRGSYKLGSPRLRESVARELVAVAEAGMWPEYASGELRASHPHLYAVTRKRSDHES